MLSDKHPKAQRAQMSTSRVRRSPLNVCESKHMRPWIWPWCVWAAYTLRFVVSVEHMAFQARELEAACEAVCTVQCSTSSLARWKLKSGLFED